MQSLLKGTIFLIVFSNGLTSYSQLLEKFTDQLKSNAEQRATNKANDKINNGMDSLLDPQKAPAKPAKNKPVNTPIDPSSKNTGTDTGGISATVTLAMSEKGYALERFYLDLRVEELWLSGHHVNWETGEPDNPSADQDTHTHCSAFVAAACKRLNIYLLRPPEHKMQLLANAQYDWLSSFDAGRKGWKLIALDNDFEEAQQYANNGYVVIAVIKSTDPHATGHIALVRPAAITQEKLGRSGPMLIMASTHNFNYISLQS